MPNDSHMRYLFQSTNHRRRLSSSNLQRYRTKTIAPATYVGSLKSQSCSRSVSIRHCPLTSTHDSNLKVCLVAIGCRKKRPTTYQRTNSVLEHITRRYSHATSWVLNAKRAMGSMHTKDTIKALLTRETAAEYMCCFKASTKASIEKTFFSLATQQKQINSELIQSQLDGSCVT